MPQVLFEGKKDYYPGFNHTGKVETTFLTSTVKDLFPGTKYNFVMFATTHCGPGENSSVVSSETPKAGRWKIFVMFQCQTSERTVKGLAQWNYRTLCYRSIVHCYITKQNNTMVKIRRGSYR